MLAAGLRKFKCKRVIARSASYEATRNNIKIDSDTTVIVQGITGKMGTLHTKLRAEYGTKFVGGVSPKKGGTRHLGLPVFSSVLSAKEALKPDATVIFVPAPQVREAIMEAVDAELPLVICITDGVPIKDMVYITHALRSQCKSRMIGPNCPGVLAAGRSSIGIVPNAVSKRGCVGIVSRSGTLSYEVINQTTALGLGQTWSVGIGGDPFPGSSFVDCLQIFLEDETTRAIVLIGEIGGEEEEKASDYLREHNHRCCHKPVVAYVAGLVAPVDRRMGHAGAIITRGKGRPEDKVRALRDVGVIVTKSVAQIGPALRDVMARSKLI
ncbi:succinate--CoA ligase [ADP/GDP-forming] subunit alpha, mitochondrial-like [Cylas formicarius]|uniref:succinate--CoA ligase [ADP/GDP-forming] subunit alpha, mitochondrial-like n=1 Tax=Cylas formicarius TaxID=197179 RepID=UPI00295887AD|nr:succinate--CoA ligase [ADP/GDP-forming] subunit alpha, mitochondrial-like [Cylas formicarius]